MISAVGSQDWQTALYFRSEPVQVSDYEPFGSELVNRTWTRNGGGTEYRYGFNGKENDDEVLSAGRFQDYGMRLYRPDLGRFVSVDPLALEYPWWSSYHFGGNSPIANVDRDGLESLYYLYRTALAGNDVAKRIHEMIGIPMASLTDVNRRVSTAMSALKGSGKSNLYTTEEEFVRNKDANFPHNIANYDFSEEGVDGVCINQCIDSRYTEVDAMAGKGEFSVTIGWGDEISIKLPPGSLSLEVSMETGSTVLSSESSAIVKKWAADGAAKLTAKLHAESPFASTADKDAYQKSLTAQLTASVTADAGASASSEKSKSSSSSKTSKSATKVFTPVAVKLPTSIKVITVNAEIHAPNGKVALVPLGVSSAVVDDNPTQK